MLSAEYANMHQPENAALFGRKAFDLRDHVTEREKMSLLDRYYGRVTGQLEERIQTDRLWSLTFLGDFSALAYGGGSGMAQSATFVGIVVSARSGPATRE